jgi:hypothetical protein
MCVTLKVSIILKNCLEKLLNPLNAELNSICHLLVRVLLGDLFMGPCIVSIF